MVVVIEWEQDGVVAVVDGVGEQADGVESRRQSETVGRLRGVPPLENEAVGEAGLDLRGSQGMDSPVV